nr:MAG TPA_asm: hypothetical protein [Caudoviricetes sp.]
MDLSERTLQVLVGARLGIGFVPKLLLTMPNTRSIISVSLHRAHDWGF